MEAVRVETLTATKSNAISSLLNTNVQAPGVITKDNEEGLVYTEDELDDDEDLRLRLSDDEEADLDGVNATELVDSQPEKSQLENTGLEFDVQIALAPKSEESHQTDLSSLQNCAENESSVDKADGVKHKQISNDISRVDENSLDMSEQHRIPPLVRNSQKYWNYESRWRSGSNRSRHSFNGRVNDWDQQYQKESDSYNTNIQKYGHYGRLRSNSNGSGHYNKNKEGNCWQDKNSKLPQSTDKTVSDSMEDPKKQENYLQTNGTNSPVCEETEVADKTFVDNIDKEASKENETLEETFVPDEELKDEIQQEQNVEESTNNENINDEHLSDEYLDDSTMIEEHLEFNEPDSESVTENKYETVNGDDETGEEVNESNEIEEPVSDLAEADSRLEEVPENEEMEDNLSVMEKETEAPELDIPNEEMAETAAEDIVETNAEAEAETDACNDEDQIGVVESTTNEQEEVEFNLDSSTDVINEDSGNALEEGLEETEEVSENPDGIEAASNETTCEGESAEEAKETNESVDESKVIPDEKNEATLQNGTEEQEHMEVDEDVTTSGSAEVKPVNETNRRIESDTDTTSSQVSTLTNDEYSNDVQETVYTEKKGECIDEIENSKLDDIVKTINQMDEKMEDGEKTTIVTIIEEVDLAEEEPAVVEEEQPKVSETDLKSIAASTDVKSPQNESSVNEEEKSNSSVVEPETSVVNEVVDSTDDKTTGTYRRKRWRRSIAGRDTSDDSFQAAGNARQKRRSARNAEEIIRKELTASDVESSDSSDKFVPVSKKKSSNTTQQSSPSSLKRTLENVDNEVEVDTNSKKIKTLSAEKKETVKEAVKPVKKDLENVVEAKEVKNKVEIKTDSQSTSELVRKLCQEDIRGKLKKLKPEELEALLIQKIIETITIRGEIGKLREQARISKRNQEATRARCQLLSKQVEGFEMVLKRIAIDKAANNDKYVTPIKINRSVGLQVNIISDQGMQNIQQLQQRVVPKVVAPSSANNSPVAKENARIMPVPSPRKGIKTRSPRRPEVPTVTPAIATATQVQSPVHIQPNMTQVTPAALVMSKQVDAKRSIAMQNPQLHIVPQSQAQTIVVNGNIASNRTMTLTTARQNNNINKTNDLIDLTDEEDKTKTPNTIAKLTAIPTSTIITENHIGHKPQLQQNRYPRVIQALPPGSVAVTTQPGNNLPANVRLVPQPANQVSQTAIVNGVNPPRLTYVMQSRVGPTRQLVLTNSTMSNAIRPLTATVGARNAFPSFTYKGAGIPGLPNGTVRVLASTQANLQLARHPAPLPDVVVTEGNPAWKLPPPAPSLKISKVSTGIVLSWNMSLSDKYADIVSYQLYAYQEVAGTSPSTALWKKVGDVRALPLPMACTLTQFSEGNNYYFAVRAVDAHSRIGKYSIPGNITL